MNFKKLGRNTIMLSICLLVFAVTPGFGKMDLEDYSIDKNGGWNRLTEGTLLNIKNEGYGFEVHCAGALLKEKYASDSGGLTLAAFAQ